MSARHRRKGKQAGEGPGGGGGTAASASRAAGAGEAWAPRTPQTAAEYLADVADLLRTKGAQGLSAIGSLISRPPGVPRKLGRYLQGQRNLFVVEGEGRSATVALAPKPPGGGAAAAREASSSSAGSLSDDALLGQTIERVEALKKEARGAHREEEDLVRKLEEWDLNLKALKTKIDEGRKRVAAVRRRKKRVDRELREEQVNAKALCESDESFRDWGAGLPRNVLAALFQSLSQEREADFEGRYRDWGIPFGPRHKLFAKRDPANPGHDLLPYALVCQGWREGVEGLGGHLRSRASSVVSVGRLEYLKWALSLGCPETDKEADVLPLLDLGLGGDRASVLSDFCAANGDIRLLKYLCERQGGQDYYECHHALHAAKSQRGFQLLKWLAQSKRARKEISDALKAEDASYYQDPGYGPDYQPPPPINSEGAFVRTLIDYILDPAAEGNCLATVRWAVGLGAHLDEGVLECAAMGGAVDVMEYLVFEAQIPWSRDMAVFATENGHLNVLEWAHEKELPMSKVRCLRAADRHGHHHCRLADWLRALPDNEGEIDDGANYDDQYFNANAANQLVEEEPGAWNIVPVPPTEGTGALGPVYAGPWEEGYDAGGGEGSSEADGEIYDDEWETDASDDDPYD